MQLVSVLFQNTHEGLLSETDLHAWLLARTPVLVAAVLASGIERHGAIIDAGGQLYFGIFPPEYGDNGHRRPADGWGLSWFPILHLEMFDTASVRLVHGPMVYDATVNAAFDAVADAIEDPLLL